MTVNPDLVQHTLGDLVDVTEPKRPWWMPSDDTAWNEPLPRSGLYPVAVDAALREPEETP